MKRILTRTLGIALVAAGVAGLVFSIIGLIALVRLEPRVESAVMDKVDLVDQTLTAMAEGLALAETSLTQAANAASSLESAMGGVSQAVGDATPTLDLVARFLGEQLPEAIETTQEALRSVATSAQIVDDILLLVTDIPFLGIERYNPEVPLNRTFEEVANSLDKFPASLNAAQDGLEVTIDNLGEMEKDFGAMAEGIGALTTSLRNAESVLTEYQDIVAEFQSLVALVRQGSPGWLRWIHLSISMALIWLGIAQVGLVAQGWGLVGRSRHPSL